MGFTFRASPYGAYVRGKLVLAGFTDLSRVDGGSYLDAIYATIADAPGEVIEKLNKEITLAGSKIAPDRDSWGLLPEHQQLAGSMRPEPQNLPPMPSGRAT